MAAKNDIDKAKAKFDGTVAQIREKARGLAYRVRPFLATDQQLLLDEVLRSEDPARILVGTGVLAKRDLATFVKVESYQQTLLPSLTLFTGLLLRVCDQMARLNRAELIYEIAKRKCAAESPAGEHEAGTRSQNASAVLGAQSGERLGIVTK